ncbi:MAG: T9SS type A sorting domain-containing protein [Saprospiraceae bacterium]|nr:T9SS type A sorting domain-containing protein [Saprospiraceae bacterium]
MWKGITVKGGIHAEDNTIRDAQWAVRCENKSSIWVQNNFFEQNYVAFYTPLLAPLTASVNTVRILGNLVTGAGLLKPAYGSSDPNTPHPQIPAPGERSFAGAFLNDVSGFIIDAGNQFVQLRNGVIAYRSTFSFKQSEIADLISFVYPTGAEPEPAFHHNLSGIRAYDCLLADISGNEIQHVFKGVYSERSNIKAVDNGILTDILSSPTEVDEPWRASAIDVFFGNNKTTELLQNRIETWADGIYVSTCDPSGSLKIIENEVKKHPHTTNDDFFAGMGIGITRFGEIAGNRIKMMAPSGATGFTMNNCRNLFIHDNEFLDFEVGMRGNSNVSCYLLDNTAQSDVTSGSAAGTAGIGFTNAFSDNDYCCNTVNHLSAEGFVFDGPSTATSFKYSQIYGATMGLLLTESAEISPQTHARNRWYAGNGGAFHASSNQFFILNSRFICEPALIPPFATAADQPGAPVAWFLSQTLPPGPPQPLCNCPYPVDPGGGGGDLPRIMPEIDDLTAAGGHELGQYSDAYNWMTQQRLYARLAQAPELATTTAAINQFYLTSQSDLIGQYSTVGANIQNLIGRDGYTRGLLLEANADIAVLMSEVRTLEFDPNANTSALEQKREELKAGVEFLNGIGANIEQAQEGALNALLAQNDALFEPEIFQANEKTVNRIELQHRLWKSRTLPPADLTILHQIADQCPLEGGFVVFKARAILSKLGLTSNWENTANCTPAEFRSKNETYLQEHQVQVFPNPAHNTLQIANLPTHGAATLFELLNLQGKVVISLEVPVSLYAQTIDVSSLGSGLYFYRIRSGESMLKTGKIVLIH